MAYKWANKLDPSPVLRSFYVRAEVVGDSLHIRDVRAYADAAVLSSMLEGDERVSASGRFDLVWDALTGAHGQSKDDLLREVNRIEASRRRKGKKTFTLVTTLSVDAGKIPSSLQIIELTAHFSNTISPTLKAARDGIAEDYIKRGAIHADDPGYCYVTIEVIASDASDAFNKCSSELNVLRGLLCIFCNPGFEKKITGSDHQAINVIQMGSFHTIHHADGQVDDQVIWYEPSYESKPVASFRNANAVIDATTRSLEALRRRPYNNRLALALSKFASAFDEVDPDNAFVKSWSALESILTDNQADYSQLIRRCAFLYQDREYHTAVLKQLAEHRNASVHRVADASLSRTFCYLLQSYFGKALSFHIFHYQHFEDYPEALAFLSGPFTAKALDRAAARVDLARRFLRLPPAGDTSKAAEDKGTDQPD